MLGLENHHFLSLVHCGKNQLTTMGPQAPPSIVYRSKSLWNLHATLHSTADYTSHLLESDDYKP